MFSNHPEEKVVLIGDALRRCAINYSNKLAIKDEYGKHFPQGFSYTYQELFETVNRLANGLLTLVKEGRPGCRTDRDRNRPHRIFTCPDQGGNGHDSH